MAVLYRIKDWTKTFENSRTLNISVPAWIPWPVRRDRRMYRRLVRTEQGLLAYGVFAALVGIAALGKPRGTLSGDDGQPLDLQDLESMTGIPAATLSRSMQLLASEEIAWLVATALPPRGNDAAPSRARGTTRNDTTQNGTIEAMAADAAAHPTETGETGERADPAVESATKRARPVGRWRRVPSYETLSPGRRDVAIRRGLRPEDEWEAFMDCEFQKPRSDVDATWRTWCRNAQKWGHGLSLPHATAKVSSGRSTAIPDNRESHATERDDFAKFEASLGGKVKP